MRTVILLLIITAVHVAATIICGFGKELTCGFVFSSPSSTYGMWSAALKVFEFPFLTISQFNDSINPPYYPYIMVFNSLFWATVILFGIRVYRKRFVSV